jgi:two-component system, NarL family, nitrate/nitrite response regulator NarL
VLLDGVADLRVVDHDAAVILVDFGSSPAVDRGAVTAITSTYPNARVVLLTPDLEDTAVLELLRSGASGVVPKSAPSNTLFDAIRCVAVGQYWAGPETMTRVLTAMLANRPFDAKPFGLTPREREIVNVLVNGCCGNKEIAAACGISEKTVKHHLTHIFDKVGVSNRLELTVFALHHLVY